MNLRVNLTKRISTSEGFRYYPIVMSGNGRVKPGAVIVNGEEEKHCEGSYYIEWYEGPSHRAAVARTLGYGQHLTLSETLPQSGDTRQSEYDLCVKMDMPA